MDARLKIKSTTKKTLEETFDTPPKPFIKWVGGKRQLMPYLVERLPDEFEFYCEPFIGGGALMWLIAMRYPNAKIIINDGNEELVNTYRVVRDEPERLLDSLKHHQNEEGYYYAVRSMDREDWYPFLDKITRASRFIFLNKTGYNGLWRVNQKNQNNVPFGRYAHIKYTEQANLMACSRALKKAQIFCGDFEEKIQQFVRPKTFFYFDPPYVPLSETARFTSYTKNGFNMDAQIRLRNLCQKIDCSGGKFLLSNSDTDIIREMYSDFIIDTVQASRAINSDSGKRGKISEVLIRNY